MGNFLSTGIKRVEGEKKLIKSLSTECQVLIGTFFPAEEKYYLLLDLEQQKVFQWWLELLLVIVRERDTGQILLLWRETLSWHQWPDLESFVVGIWMSLLETQAKLNSY